MGKVVDLAAYQNRRESDRDSLHLGIGSPFAQKTVQRMRDRVGALTGRTYMQVLIGQLLSGGMERNYRRYLEIGVIPYHFQYHVEKMDDPECRCMIQLINELLQRKATHTNISGLFLVRNAIMEQLKKGRS